MNLPRKVSKNKTLLATETEQAIDITAYTVQGSIDGPGISTVYMYVYFRLVVHEEVEIGVSYCV